MFDLLASLSSDPRLVLLSAAAGRSLVLLLLACVAVRLMRRRASAASRHLALLAAMVGLLLLPAASLVVPALPVRCLPAVSPPPTIAAAPRAAPSAAAPTFVFSGVAGPPAARFSAPPPVPLTAADAVFGLWLAGAILGAGRMLAGWKCLRRETRRSPKVTDGRLVEQTARLAESSGARVTLRQGGADVVVPMTWGWPRATLLLPSGAGQWPEPRLCAVLLHELAHIQRADWLTLGLTQFVCALYWFNPLVWATARQMEREAEAACDDRVLLSGVAGPDYAQHLLDIARRAKVSRTAGGALAMASPRSQIPVRLAAVLESRRNRRQVTRKVLALSLTLAALLLIPLAAVRLAARADALRSGPLDNAIYEAVALSERGEWDADARLARQVLADTRATDRNRTDALRLLTEAAFWQERPADVKLLSVRYFAARKIAPDDARDFQTLTATLARPNPVSLSDESLLIWSYKLLLNADSGDALHAARCLLNRRAVPVGFRVLAWGNVRDAAANNFFPDVVELGLREGRRELARMTPQERARKEKFMLIHGRMPVTFKGVKLDMRAKPNPISGIPWARFYSGSPKGLDFGGFTDWRKESKSGTADNFDAGIAWSGPRPGLRSEWLADTTSKPPGDATLSQEFRADRFRGKRIRFSAWLRTEKVKSANVFLHLEAPTFVSTWEQRTRGTTNWTRFEIVADVPGDAQGLSFGFGAEGKGKVWASDFEFAVVGKNIAPTPPSSHFEIGAGG